MSDEWTDDDDPRLRDLFQYLLRDHVRHQDGRHSYAPALVFADADYEEGDGTCGLHVDAKSANEPAIVFVRADALVDAADRIEALEAEVARLRELVCSLRPMRCFDVNMTPARPSKNRGRTMTSLSEKMAAEDAENEKRRARGYGNYTGDECKFCGRLRVMENGLDEIVCEKCGRDQSTGDYLHGTCD